MTLLLGETKGTGFVEQFLDHLVTHKLFLVLPLGYVSWGTRYIDVKLADLRVIPLPVTHYRRSFPVA
jgi:hypothetical protein